MWIAIALHRLPYYELDQISERADNCVGTDPFHTPPSVHDAIIAAAVGEAYSVAVDVPFASYEKD